MWASAHKFLSSICNREPDGAALSRRDMLAGLGLAGLFVAAAPHVLGGVAQAAPANLPPATPDKAADASDENEKVAENATTENKTESTDATDLSAQRYWRRRYYRRRYYWRPRYYVRRRYYWRRRRWRW